MQMRGRVLSSISNQQHYEDFQYDDYFAPMPRNLTRAKSILVDGGQAPQLLQALYEMQDSDDDDFKKVAEDDDTTFGKVRKFLGLAVPSMVTMFVLMIQEIVNLVFVGRLDNPAMLAGVGMGNLTMNILSLSIAYGLNGALESLVSQAYGAGNLKLCGIFLNRSRVVLIGFMAPMMFVLSYSSQILVALGQDKDSAAYAQAYVYAFMPGLVLAALNDN